MCQHDRKDITFSIYTFRYLFLSERFFIDTNKQTQLKLGNTSDFTEVSKHTQLAVLPSGLQAGPGQKMST